MSAHALQQSEKQFQRAVVDLARACGWLVYHPFDSRRSSPGFPDLTLTRWGILVFAELKSERGWVRPDQREWHAALGVVQAAARTSFMDVVSIKVWRPSDWPEIERTLAR